MGKILLVLIIIIVLIIIWLISGYNGLVRSRNTVEEAFSTMDVYLKKRYDLIPNLVEAVKGYATHEKETLQAVISARNQVQTAGTQAERLEAENALSGTLKSLFAVAEAYPDLKSVETVKQLQDGIESVENKIAFSRNHYNQTVSDYQTKRSQFPSVIVPMFFPSQFPTFAYYQDTEKEAIQKRPEIKF